MDLRQFGLTQWTQRKIKEEFETINELIANPYRLMNQSGIGFKKADLVALKVGHNMKSEVRINSYLNFLIEIHPNPSTLLDKDMILNKVSKDLEIDFESVIRAIKRSISNGYLILDDYLKNKELEDGKYFINKKDAEAEKFLFQFIRESGKKPCINTYNAIDEVLSASTLKLNDMQEYAVRNIFKNNFNILVGKSGTGKSTSTKVVVNILEKLGKKVLLLTPTGISASVLSNAVGRQAKTIHRSYYKDKQEEKLSYDYIIVDEFGMLSTSHISMLSAYVTNKTRFIFIGDSGQIPSIGRGNFLSDLIFLKNKGLLDFGFFELTQIMRQQSESYIPYLASKFYDDCENIDLEDKIDVKFIKINDDIRTEIDKVYNISDCETTMILTPQNVGDYGTKIINEHIQKKNINNKLDLGQNYNFKVGDLCMQIKNDYSLMLFNGERLKIVDKEHVLRLSDNEVVKIQDEDFSNIQLAYSNTFHKTQGISVDHTIVILSKKHVYMLNKQLIYTALTRARKSVTILYDDELNIHRMRDKCAVESRQTILNQIGLAYKN